MLRFTLITVFVCTVVASLEGFVVPKPAKVFVEDVNNNRNYPQFGGGLQFDDLDDDLQLLFSGPGLGGSGYHPSAGFPRSRAISGLGYGALSRNSLGRYGAGATPTRYNGGSDVTGPCYGGEVLNAEGNCEQPLVTRNVFLYAAPQRPVDYPPPPQLPKPRVNYNVVFIRNPDHPKELQPIVVPPPQQKTLVYVLNKVKDIDQDVIEVPPGPVQRPEVFYVNYDEGDNPQLPFGLDLQTALASLDEQGGYGSGSAYGDRSVDVGALSAKISAGAKLNAAAQLKAVAGAALKNEGITSLSYGGDNLPLSSTAAKIYGPSKP